MFKWETSGRLVGRTDMGNRHAGCLPEHRDGDLTHVFECLIPSWVRFEKAVGSLEGRIMLEELCHW